MDFPASARVAAIDSSVGGVLSTFGPESPIGMACQNARFATAGGVWNTANTAQYIPILVPEFCTVYQLGTEVTAQAGNLDLGIYTEDGTRLVSAGSTAVGGVGIQAVNVTDTNLSPALYYLAMNCSDATTAAFKRIAPDGTTLRAHGGCSQAVGATALPNPATLASPVGYVPLIFATLLPGTP